MRHNATPGTIKRAKVFFKGGSNRQESERERNLSVYAVIIIIRMGMTRHPQTPHLLNCGAAVYLPVNIKP